MVCQLLCYTAIISMRDIIPDERLEREVRQFILHDLALSARSRSVTGYEWPWQLHYFDLYTSPHALVWLSVRWAECLVIPGLTASHYPCDHWCHNFVLFQRKATQ